MQATARIKVLTAPDRRTIDDLCPVRLCITHMGKRKYISLKEKISNNDWMFISADDMVRVWPVNKQVSPRGIYKDMRIEYDRIVREAEEIINDISVFSIGQFEERFFSKSGSWDNVIAAFIDQIQVLKAEGRYGYASTFESTLRSVIEFHRKKKLDMNCRVKVDTRYKEYLSGKKLYFQDITSGWLKKFDAYLKERGKSTSTIGIYGRNIRVIFNLAIKKHKVKADYPFTDYSPKKATGRKIALTAHQISLISNYQTEDPLKQYYRDLFMFSFLANGMNMSDIARLKYSNLIDGEIIFVREKTKHQDTEEAIRVTITNRMQDIINKHANRAIGHNAYIFPILKPKMTQEAEYYQIKQNIKLVNNYIKAIAKDVKIKENVSSYTARHSFATIARDSGAPTEFIKEALGHSNVMVTEAYLKKFEASKRRELAEKLENAVYNQMQSN